MPNLYIDVREVALGSTEEKTIPLSISPDALKELSLVKPVTGTVTLFKDDEGVCAEFEIYATIKETCERCLEEIEPTKKLQFERLYVSEPNEKEEIERELPSTFQIDVLEDIQQELMLSTPFKILCKEDCKGLCPKCGKNLNNDPNHNCKNT